MITRDLSRHSKLMKTAVEVAFLKSHEQGVSALCHKAVICFARSDKQIFSHLLPRRFETVTYANVLFCRILTV